MIALNINKNLKKNHLELFFSSQGQNIVVEIGGSVVHICVGSTWTQWIEKWVHKVRRKCGGILAHVEVVWVWIRLKYIVFIYKIVRINKYIVLKWHCKINILWAIFVLVGMTYLKHLCILLTLILFCGTTENWYLIAIVGCLNWKPWLSTTRVVCCWFLKTIPS